MVSSDSACISETVPLIHMLEHTLRGIMDRAFKAEQREEEEDFLISQGPLYPDSGPACPPSSQEEQEEEEDDCIISMEVEPTLSISSSSLQGITYSPKEPMDFHVAGIRWLRILSSSVTQRTVPRMPLQTYAAWPP